ncbi:PAS and ANTAR domain-containing protein [Nocardioides mesophilus]|uniref:PAS and ANTAR domain-containing protein n=1 Tax=Nocardioides mesophilus TaxID=433659 RepID=A0A7G9R8J0_9ACTN|nr:PAS and ANTAR domain-containing protein [Nocardioides mesophilus]QNN51915.1 PAS and ANTAR domain-containing protein [Nocardioides mesophilus]
MGDSELSRVPSVPAHVAAFSFDLADETWSWTPEVFDLLGREPGAGTPSEALLLEAVHPEDRDAVASVLRRGLAGGTLSAAQHRLGDRDGAPRLVLIVVAPHRDPDRVTGVTGYLVDLSALLADQLKAAADAAVAASAERRATIEQAKGVLMTAYGLDPDAAFALLQWWSSNRNVKLAVLAERLVRAVRAGTATSGELRLVLDRVLDDVSQA